MPRFGLLIATGLLAAGRDRAETLPAAGHLETPRRRSLGWTGREDYGP
jgi:hypothetical protein